MTIVTWRNHPSEHKNMAELFFHFIPKENIFKEIKMLDIESSSRERYPSYNNLRE